METRTPCTILIVEDDESIRETLRVAIEITGYHVVTANNGLQALNELRRMPAPCLILLDLMMPVMDGFEFDRALSESPKTNSIPVVAITAFPEKARALIHARDIVSKPFEFERLISVINRYCKANAA